MFVNQISAMIIWEALGKKYEVDDTGKKKYVVGIWLQFQMIDKKLIMKQIHGKRQSTFRMPNIR